MAKGPKLPTKAEERKETRAHERAESPAMQRAEKAAGLEMHAPPKKKVGAGADKKKNWVAGAIKRPGQLHKDLGVPQGQKIPPKKMAAAASGSMGPKTKQRAQLAETLGKMGK